MLKNSKSQVFHLGKHLNVSILQKENNINHRKQKPIKEARVFGRDIKNKQHVSPKSSSHSKAKAKPKNKTKYELKVHKETRDTVTLLSKIEESHAKDPQYVTDYSSTIFDHLKDTEMINRPDYASMQSLQNKISEKTRLLLIDWLIAVHNKFDLLPQSLYLAIIILDRYTCLKHMEVSQYQLIGTASLLIAAKSEEIYAPEIRDFVYISKKAFTREEIMLAEFKVLSLLKFDLIAVNPYDFVQRYHFLSGNQSPTALNLAQYIIEMSIMKIALCAFSPSVLASTALCLSWKMLKECDDTRRAYMVILQLHSGYKEKDLKRCMKEMVSNTQKAIKNHKSALYAKFTSEKYSNVANLFSEDDFFLNDYEDIGTKAD